MTSIASHPTHPCLTKQIPATNKKNASSTLTNGVESSESISDALIAVTQEGKGDTIGT